MVVARNQTKSGTFCMTIKLCSVVNVDKVMPKLQENFTYCHFIK